MELNEIQARKQEHIELCRTDAVAFKEKSSGFEHYDFIHNALTEADIKTISLKKDFFGKQVNLPFIISCMTGGVTEADNINMQLAEAARELSIPLGLGSLRYAIDNSTHNTMLKELRVKAGNIPLMANIGAAQLAEHAYNFSPLLKLADISGADVFVVHLNPLQEMLQKGGQVNFAGLLKALEIFRMAVGMPVIVKETGAGISPAAAKSLLDAGIAGIDTAGAGGTSWAGVEILRNNEPEENRFWDWGLPTSYCIRKTAELKKQQSFVLIGSGGINTAFESAKALALGADFTASARVVLQVLAGSGPAAVIELFSEWTEALKKIMYLTGSGSLASFSGGVIAPKKELV